MLGAVAPAAEPQGRDTPTMTNSTLEAPPEPLPAGWPVGAKDAQLRGAVCESGYGREDARKAAAPGDAVLPILGTATANFDASYLGVRPQPYLTRRDVLEATLVADPQQAGRFGVRLELSEEGARKVQAYTAANFGKCIAFVAGGKILWAASIGEQVESDVYTLGGGFSATTGLAIVELFNGR
jgi:preprotein translocase subunit SecD